MISVLFPHLLPKRIEIAYVIRYTVRQLKTLKEETMYPETTEAEGKPAKYACSSYQHRTEIRD